VELQVVLVSGCRTAVEPVGPKKVQARRNADGRRRSIKRAGIPADLMTRSVWDDPYGPAGLAACPPSRYQTGPSCTQQRGVGQSKLRFGYAYLEIAAHNIMLGKTDIGRGRESMTNAPICRRSGKKSRSESSRTIFSVTLIDELIPGHGVSAEYRCRPRDQPGGM
jgi:hypothetical protein